MNIHNFSTLRISGGAGSGGALGLVPDWAKKVDVSGAYTVPADGMLYAIWTSSSYNLSINGASFTKKYFDNFPVKKGDSVVAGGGMNAAFVPYMARQLGKPKFSDAINISSGSTYTAPADGLFSVYNMASTKTYSINGLGIGGNIMFFALYYVNAGAVLSVSTTFSSSDTERINFVPCR